MTGALVAALVCTCVLAATAATAAAETATFSATETVPVPPASNFAGSGGGDGWAVALSETAVYNVFHHQGTLQVACHLQADAKTCWSPQETRTITDGSGKNFSTSGHPGMYLDRKTGKLYVYATRDDSTGGVVCVDTTIAATASDPFCGFTELTPVGQAPQNSSGWSAISVPMLVGTRWYAFNYVNNVNVSGAENELLCFDVSTDAPCGGQPFAVSFGAGIASVGAPSPATAAIGGHVIVPISAGGTEELACFDDSTKGNCAGSWPVALGFGYAGFHGSPFPLLAPTGTPIGLCLSTGTDQCFTLEGASTPTPPEMASAIGSSISWNGPALVLGPRVYVPEWPDNVDCYDYSTGKSCTNFPKTVQNLDLLYTVNADPQRPTCIWVNSDNGSAQIQNFDAYTGEACGQGTIRVLASQFVVPEPQCTPASYVSLQVLQPARSTYVTGSVAFANGDGEPIGLPEVALDETGTASLAGLELNTPTGLPQFLFTLTGENKEIGEVEVKLTWTADYDASCIGEHTTVTAPPAQPAPAPAAKPAAAPAPVPRQVVLAAHTAHLASGSKACVASSSYLASVSGKDIASVSFVLDGHKLKTLSKANSHGAFALRVPVKAGRAEHLAIHVAFTSVSSNRSQTLHKTLARCAVARRVSKPRFTG